LKQLAELLEMKYSPLRHNNKLVKCIYDDDPTKLSSFLVGDAWRTIDGKDNLFKRRVEAEKEGKLDR
jgi:hypothetical protein